MAGTYDFRADQGATFDRLVTWTDSDGEPINVSGWSARMVIRDRIGGTELHTFSTDDGSIVLGGVSGTIRLLASAEGTKEWTWGAGVYDLALTDPGPNPPLVTVLLRGRFIVIPGVTL